MTRVAVLVALVVFVGSSGAEEGAFEWVLEESYTFQAFHDPGELDLEDAAGASSQLYFGYRGLTYDQVSSWPKGKAIRVRYSPEEGTHVVDPAEGKRYRIVGAWPRIDALLERCLAQAEGRISRQFCVADATAAWQTELDRAYQRLMESGYSEEMKSGIRAAQARWVEFRDAQLAALRVYATEAGGTMQRSQVSEAALAITEAQTRRLLMMLQFASEPS